MSGAQLKKHKRYLFYRIYCLAVMIVCNVTFLQSDSHHMALLYPLAIPAMFMLSNWAVFSWDYSVFGKFERTPLPEDSPLLEQKFSWGHLGRFSGEIVPFVTWRVYRTGLGISILGAGTVFIPSADLVSLEESGRFFPGYKLKHSSQEIPSPITIYSKRVFEALKAL